MTTPEIIKQIIEESNHTSSTKTLANRHVDYLAYILSIDEKNHELIETVTREKYFFDILYVSDEVIFYLVFGDDEWCDKYPVRFIYKNDKEYEITYNIIPLWLKPLVTLQSPLSHY